MVELYKEQQMGMTVYIRVYGLFAYWRGYFEEYSY